jgi:hypothetical protein
LLLAALYLLRAVVEDRRSFLNREIRLGPLEPFLLRFAGLPWWQQMAVTALVVAAGYAGVVNMAARVFLLAAIAVTAMVAILRGRRRERDRSARLARVRLEWPGWSEQPREGDSRVWTNGEGDLLTLTLPPTFEVPPFSDERSLQTWCRSLAAACGAGLIEVATVGGPLGETAAVVQKTLDGAAYVVAGFLIVPSQGQLWRIVSWERGITGQREFAVTEALVKSGRLTLEDYKSSWARDPYDPLYEGVDRSVLRFQSDDACYDRWFPDHPLSKVRRFLSDLPGAVRVDPSSAIVSGGANVAP